MLNNIQWIDSLMWNLSNTNYRSTWVIIELRALSFVIDTIKNFKLPVSSEEMIEFKKSVKHLRERKKRVGAFVSKAAKVIILSS